MKRSASPPPSPSELKRQRLVAGLTCYQTRNIHGQLIREEWRKGSERHCLDGPAVQDWNAQGQLIRARWYKNDDTHRRGGPAVQVWNDQGQLTNEEWWVNDEQHRVDGPAALIWNDQGQLISEEWFENDVPHRIDGPAMQEWNNQGQLISESWWQDGKRHRDGFLPATHNGEYFKQGHPCTLEELQTSGLKIRILLNRFRLQIRLRKRTIARGLEQGGCVMFPGLLRILHQFRI